MFECDLRRGDAIVVAVPGSDGRIRETIVEILRTCASRIYVGVTAPSDVTIRRAELSPLDPTDRAKLRKVLKQKRAQEAADQPALPGLPGGPSPSQPKRAA